VQHRARPPTGDAALARVLHLPTAHGRAYHFSMKWPAGWLLNTRGDVFLNRVFALIGALVLIR
jgi:hypothetical protein